MSSKAIRVVVALGSVTLGLWSGLEAYGGPLGPETRLNVSTSGSQLSPAVVKDSAGNFVVVWEGAGSQSGQSDGTGVFMRRFDAAGAPLGGEIRVNTTTSGAQIGVDVDLDANGNFVVVWEGNGAQVGHVDSYGVFAQRFFANGARNGGEFKVNTYTLGDQAGPGVAMAPNGSFVVSWESDGQDGSGMGVYAQRYNPDGTPNGAEFLVNSFTVGEQAGPSLVLEDDGSLLVVWESDGQLPDANGFGVFARRFDGSGPLGSEFLVNTVVVGDQAGGDVDVDGAGNMLIVWESYGQDASGTFGAYGQRFDGAGNKVGSEFRVNTTTAGDQAGPDVDYHSGGGFVVTWDSYGQDGSGFGVYAQRFDAGANKLASSDIRVNTTTSSNQLGPAIDTDPNGDFLVVWEGNGTGDTAGVFAQRFEFTPPDTTILSGPDPDTTATSATFTFASTEAGSTFECRLDAAAFAACTSPKSYTGLPLGAHTFQVRAIDAALNIDPLPAVWSWGVLDSSPPTTKLLTPANGKVYLNGSEILAQAGYTVVVGPMTLVGEARDPDSGIGSLMFEIDGVGYAPTSVTVDGSGKHTFSMTWTPSLPPGSHSIRTVAFNGAGLFAFSAAQPVLLAV